MNPFLEAAKRYLAFGLTPIPIEPAQPGNDKSGKRPLIAWREYMDSPPTLEEVTAWWTKTPNANLALITGHDMFVVDIDGPEGERALLEAGIEFPFEAPRVSTGRGEHVYLSGDVPDRIGLLPKVDIRSGGGYVVAPPSVHANGERYTWKTSFVDRPPDAPDALLELLRLPTRPTLDHQQHGWLDTALAGVGEGQRDQTCTRLAGYLLGKGLPAEAVESLLIAWSTRCTPAFPADQVVKCVESIARRHGDVQADPEPELDGGAAIVQFIENLLTPNKPRRVVPTGLTGLDTALNGGLYPGQATYLAGIGGVGKSITAQMIAIRAALAGTPTLYATLEMPVTDVMARLISYFTLIDSRDIIAILRGQREATASDTASFQGVLPTVSNLPLVIRQSIDTVSAIDNFLTARSETKLVVVDQLHHLRHPEGLSGMHGLEANSRALVALAGKHDIPVVGICQVNRPDSRYRQIDWRPTRYSLRGSEQLYHDAATVLLFHRAFDTPDILEIQVAKGRMGGATDSWAHFKYTPEHCEVG